MRAILGAALVLLAGPAFAQSPASYTCGVFKVETAKKANTTTWTVARGNERSTESAVLRDGPKLECIEGQVLSIEFTPSSGQPFLDLEFPDGATIAYGGQHLRRNGRLVLPIQARRRMPAQFRQAFDYHCRLEMPADPIRPEDRKDCVL